MMVKKKKKAMLFNTRESSLKNNPYLKKLTFEKLNLELNELT